jgi:hypothetical protein
MKTSLREYYEIVAPLRALAGTLFAGDFTI